MMQDKIETLEGDNIGERKRIEDEAWDKIEDLKEKNKEELTFQIKKGIKDKASL